MEAGEPTKEYAEFRSRLDKSGLSVYEQNIIIMTVLPPSLSGIPGCESEAVLSRSKVWEWLEKTYAEMGV